MNLPFRVVLVLLYTNIYSQSIQNSFLTETNRSNYIKRGSLLSTSDIVQEIQTNKKVIVSYKVMNFDRDSTWPGTSTRGKLWADRDLYVWDPRMPTAWNSMPRSSAEKNLESTSNPRRVVNRAEGMHASASLSPTFVQSGSIQASDGPFDYYYS